MRGALPLTILFLSGAAAHAKDWTTIRNDRYGFAVEIPAAFKALPPPENDDGLEFTSPDGGSTIKAYGHLFVDVKGLVEDERQEEGFSTSDGLHVTYRQVSPQAWTFSGLKGDRITYQHAVPTCRGLASALLYVDYPASQKATFDPLLAHMVKTLRGSNGCWVPG